MNINPSYGTGFARRKAECADEHKWQWDGLVAAYGMFLGPTGELKDIAGDHHGTLTNMDVTDWQGDALNFPGVTEYVALPNLGLFGDIPRTIICRFTVGTFNGIMNPWSWGSDATRTKCGLHFDVHTDNLYWAWGASDYYTGNNILARDGTVYNVACVYDGGNLSTSTVHIYVDGQPKSLTEVAPQPGVPNTSETSYSIAKDTAANREWDGRIESVLYYDRALNPTQILEHNRNPKGVFIRKPPVTYFVSAAPPVGVVPQIQFLRMHTL